MGTYTGKDMAIGGGGESSSLRVRKTNCILSGEFSFQGCEKNAISARE